MEKETVAGVVAWWGWYEEVHLLNHRIIEQSVFLYAFKLQGEHPVSGTVRKRNVTRI
jgi:hypothetical protein